MQSSSGLITIVVMTLFNCFSLDEPNVQNGVEVVISPGGTHHSLQSLSNSSSMSGKFEQLAGTIFQHCNEALSNDIGAAYDVPQYPIADSQQKGQIVREISMR